MSAYTTTAASILTEHLHYSPISLIDDIINAVNELMYSTVSEVEKFLLNSHPGSLGFKPPPGRMADTDEEGNELLDDKDREELEKGVHKLETLLENAVDRNFDLFELYVLRNILNVDPSLAGWLRLGHHEGIEFQENGDEVLKAQIMEFERLRLERVASHELNVKLKAEAHRNAQLIAQLKAATGETKPTDSTPLPKGAQKTSFLFEPKGGLEDGAAATRFSIDQVKMLKELLVDLRSKYEKMKNGEMEVGLTAKEKERKKYIEKMTRRAFELEGQWDADLKAPVVVGQDRAKEEIEVLKAASGATGEGGEEMDTS